MFAKTAWQPQREVSDFLLNNQDFGQAFSTVFAAGLREEWKATARKLLANAFRLRQAFAQCVEILGGAPGGTDLSILPAVGVSFAKGAPCAEVQAQLLELCGVPIKLDAAGIGRQRFMAEVLALQSRLPVSCPVVLDASGNGLIEDDFSQLVELAGKCRNVYYLDVSNNPLCAGDQVCWPMVDLLRRDTPLVRLGLENTGCNEASAKQMAQTLHQHHSLGHLNLRGNRIGAVGARLLVMAVHARKESNRDPSQLRLQGNPGTKACLDALNTACRMLQRHAFHAEIKVKFLTWRGYALMGEHASLLELADQLNGTVRGSSVSRKKSLLVELGESGEDEKQAEAQAQAQRL